MNRIWEDTKSKSAPLKSQLAAQSPGTRGLGAPRAWAGPGSETHQATGSFHKATPT